MAVLQHWTELNSEPSGSSVSRRRLDGAGASLVRVDIKAGAKADRHSHPHEQFVQVLAGRGTLHTEGASEGFSAGSLFHFPANTWHAADFDEDTILVETNLRA